MNDTKELTSGYKKFVQNRIENIRDSDLLTFQAAQGLAPWLVPIAPALVFGWVFYTSVTGAEDHPMDSNLALAGAIAIAIGLVVAGAMSSHVAVTLQSYGVDKNKVNFAWSLVIAYVALEIGGLLAMELFGAYLIVVGIVASLLTLDVYLARSLATRLTEEKQAKEQEQEQIRENEKDDKAHQREIERLQLQMEQERELARIEAQNRKDLEKIQADKEKNIAKLTVKKASNEMSSSGQDNVQNDQKQALLDIILSNPDFNKTATARQLNMSRQTLYNRLDELKSEGKIKVNGNGYEVINGNGAAN